MYPAAAADPKKLRRYRATPSVQTDQKLRFIQKERAKDKVDVLTRNQPIAMLNNPRTRFQRSGRSSINTSRYSQYIVHVEMAQHARLKTHRWTRIFPFRSRPYLRKISAVCAARMFAQ